MIKGKYAAMVEVEIAYNEEILPGVPSFEDMERFICDGLYGLIKAVVKLKVGRLGTVEITQAYADLYRVQED